MNDQRACISDIGEMGEELEVFDQSQSGVIAALEAKGEDGASALGAIFAGQLMIAIPRQAGIADPFDLIVL